MNSGWIVIALYPACCLSMIVSENRYPPIGSWPEGLLFRSMLKACRLLMSRLATAKECNPRGGIRYAPTDLLSRGYNLLNRRLMTLAVLRRADM